MEFSREVDVIDSLSHLVQLHIPRSQLDVEGVKHRVNVALVQSEVVNIRVPRFGGDDVTFVNHLFDVNEFGFSSIGWDSRNGWSSGEPFESFVRVTVVDSFVVSIGFGHGFFQEGHPHGVVGQGRGTWLSVATLEPVIVINTDFMDSVTSVEMHGVCLLRAGALLIEQISDVV